MSFRTSENTKLSSSAPNVPRSAFTRSNVSPRTVASSPESRKWSLGVLTIRFSELLNQGCTVGIGLSGLKDRLIIESDIGSASIRHFWDERGLAGPARPHDQDHRRVRKGFLCPPLHKSLEHAIPNLGQSEPLGSAN
jgi:hypothetical protein